MTKNSNYLNIKHMRGRIRVHYGKIRTGLQQGSPLWEPSFPVRATENVTEGLSLRFNLKIEEGFNQHLRSPTFEDLVTGVSGRGIQYEKVSGLEAAS